jgi:flagellar biosynthetic protein FlhB
MWIVAPLFALVLLLSPIINMAQTGFNVAKDKLAIDWSRIDPMSGLKRFAGARQWIEGAKSLLKIGAFIYLAWITLESALPTIKLLGARDLRAQLDEMLGLALLIGTRIAVLMAILAVLDYGYQWWEFYKKTLMTHQEMKDESKEREGNPLIKQRQRSLAMQRLRQRMMSEIPKASVIVTNPTHFAVALRYDRLKAPAPYVCAKGADHMAARIREIAREHGVPIIENKLLARALYRSVRVGQIIPSEFYKAVAEVLAFVHLLRQRRQRGGGSELQKRYV